MKPPKKVKVGAHTYSVVFTADKNKWQDGNRNVGETSYDTAELFIRPGQPPSFERDTVLHECLHVIFTDTGMTEFPAENEEEFILRLTPALIALLRRNPKLVEYLCA